MNIFSIESGIAYTHGYLLTDEKNGVGIIIDTPQNSTEFFLAKADELNITIQALLLTHSHWDHTFDVAELKRRTNAPIYLHQADEYRLTEPMKHTIYPLPFTIEGANVDIFLHHGDILTFGDWQLKVLHTPGHTEGGVCFLVESEQLALTGDTLFAGSVGRTDLPGGDTEMLINSIQRELLTLPDDTRILPGHGEHSTIGIERETNPFL